MPHNTVGECLDCGAHVRRDQLRCNDCGFSHWMREFGFADERPPEGKVIRRVRPTGRSE